MFNLELLLSILSLQIGLENLELNQKQIDGLTDHLNKQDDILQKEQNEMLYKILENQKTIINLLEKGGKK